MEVYVTAEKAKQTCSPKKVTTFKNKTLSQPFSMSILFRRNFFNKHNDVFGTAVMNFIVVKANLSLLPGSHNKR